jgi:zinc transporter ZupT
MMKNPILINSFLSGAIVIAAWAIALFFLRFKKTTNDRLFGFFAAAFFLIGLERIVLELNSSELPAQVYLIRLTAFLLILIGILDKNRKEKKP